MREKWVSKEKKTAGDILPAAAAQRIWFNRTGKFFFSLLFVGSFIGSVFGVCCLVVLRGNHFQRFNKIDDEENCFFYIYYLFGPEATQTGNE